MLTTRPARTVVAAVMAGCIAAVNPHVSRVTYPVRAAFIVSRASVGCFFMSSPSSDPGLPGLVLCGASANDAHDLGRESLTALDLLDGKLLRFVAVARFNAHFGIGEGDDVRREIGGLHGLPHLRCVVQ